MNNKIEKLAYEIISLLQTWSHEFNEIVNVPDDDEYATNFLQGTNIYWNGKCLEDGEKMTDKVASDYFKYTNNDTTIAMSFEGDLYEVFNYGSYSISDELLQDFNNLINSYGYYYELGDPWNLALYEV